MQENPILLQKKYIRIVKLLAEQMEISLDEALGMFYNSFTYEFVSHGISDMHCRTDQNLVDEIIAEQDDK